MTEMTEMTEMTKMTLFLNCELILYN
ncbi:hypothetical protein W490_02500 [Staphylococcus aureus VET0191R]|nr:hypothetical protein W490_02500 [Staphylococcus aureus VET0191R]KAD76481.1 hypothetical protein W580_02652 [Staphylococcus aureus VET0316R]